MVDGIGIERTNHRQIVDDAGGPGQQFADPCGGAAELRKLEMRGRNRKTRLPRGHSRQHLTSAHGFGQVNVKHRFQIRLVIPHVLLGRTA